MGHLVYVTAGTKTWITANGEIPAFAGDAVFCKPGACHMRNFFETDFCALIFFFPRNLVQEVVLENNLEQLEMNSSIEFQAFSLTFLSLTVAKLLPGRYRVKDNQSILSGVWV